MIILGIDPGSRKVGYGVVELKQRKFRHIESGTLFYHKVGKLIDRLPLIHQDFQSLVQKFNPDEVSIESLVYVKNVNSLAKLSQARGAIIAALGKQYNGKIFEYSPNLVKSCVTGHGHATKESVIKIMRLFFGGIEFKTDDESDALAIAMCHGLSRKGTIKSEGAYL